MQNYKMMVGDSEPPNNESFLFPVNVAGSVQVAESGGQSCQSLRKVVHRQ